jgi:hypothetical protein
VLATIRSATLLGARGRPVTVEVHVGQGLPGFSVVGLPDAVCREARDRVRAALLSSEVAWPNRRVTVNLAPSGMRKGGAGSICRSPSVCWWPPRSCRPAPSTASASSARSAGRLGAARAPVPLGAALGSVDPVVASNARELDFVRLEGLGDRLVGRRAHPLPSG